MSEALIQPIISLYTSTDTNDWDYLNEQGQFLVGKISKELGEKATQPFLEAIEKHSISNTMHPTLFLHESLFFVDHQKALPQTLRILEKEDYVWLVTFAIQLAHSEIYGALPRLKEILNNLKKTDPDDIEIVDIQEAVNEMETGVAAYPEFKKPSFESRGHWKKEYENFYRKTEPVYMQQPVKKQKIGRNDLCPCGSGKKYKKCCSNLGHTF